MNPLGPVSVARLFLLFRIGTQRYALAAMDVDEVLPLLPFKTVAQAPDWVAGIFAHRGELVPVLDLSALTFGQPAVERTSTRLVLVRYQQRLLGLILEQATDTLRCDPAAFRPYPLDNRATPYLGPVLEDAQGLLQWIRVEQLLTAEARALLYDATAQTSVASETPP